MQLLYVICFCFLVFTRSVQVEGRIAFPAGVNVPALFTFGDSIVDTGNNNNRVSIVLANFHPYGMNFTGGKPSGRFCNGKVPSDLIAEELGIKELLPSYLNSNLTAEDLATGVSFASGGSGYDPLTPQLMNVYSLTDQLNLFKECIGKLNAHFGADKTSRIISDSLFLVVAGSDDLANTYFTTPLRSIQYDVHSYTDLLVQHASSFIEALYGLGARRIGVFSAPPLGCLPSQRTVQNILWRNCAAQVNDASLVLNNKMSAAFDQLNAKLKCGKVVYVDIYNPLLDIIQNPQRHGFKVVDKGCCGTGKVEVSVLCNPLTPRICPDVRDYVFFDSFHPTEKTYQAIVYPLVQKYSPILLQINTRC